MAVAKSRSTVKKVSKWSQLVAEATKDVQVFEPYEFDAYDPPLLITAPDSLERSLALATLMDSLGQVEPEELFSLIEALVGEENIDLVWAKIKGEKVEVALALVQEINEHFNAQADEGAGDLPGGE